MSIKDAYGVFSDAQALTATAYSENILDMGGGYDAWGTAKTAAEFCEGRQLYLNVVAKTELDSAGDAATLTIALSSSDTESGSYTAAYTSAAIAEASLGAGKRACAVAIPQGMSRFWKLTYTVGTEDFTSGTVDAWIGLEPVPSK